jgi:hypothetical protein
MKFTLEITCDNDAFEDSVDREVSSILDDLSHRIYLGENFDRVVLFDHNGNRVGFAQFTEDK